MKFIKQFESFTNEEVFDSKYALSKILDKYTESDVCEMFDLEIIEWVDPEWADDYDTEYDWYQDHGNGEAEDVVISNLIDWFESTYTKLSSEERSELHNLIEDAYYL